MKALEKDRGRRYESAAALAADVERFLNHEPVAAGPPTLRYRFGKFVRRNRVAVTAAALVLLSLVVAVAGTSWGMVEARRQRDAADAARRAEAQRAEAERSAKEAEALQRRAAVEEAANAAAVRDFLFRDLLLQSAPFFQAGPGEPDRDVKVRTLLDRAAARLPGPFKDRPLLEGSIRSSIGETYLHLGDEDAAAPHLARAVDLLAQARGQGHVDTIRAGMGLVSVESLRGDFSAAERRLAPVLTAARGAPDLPPEVRADVLLQAAAVADRHRKAAEAEAFLAEAGPVVAQLGDHLAAVQYDFERAYHLVLVGRYADAEAVASEGLVRCRRLLGDTHPLALLLLGEVAISMSLQDKHEEAIVQQRRHAELNAQIHGPEHPEALGARFDLARALQDGGHWAEAEACYRGVIAAQERRRGPDHPDTLLPIGYLAETVRAQGRYADAESLYERVRVARRARQGPGSRPEAFYGAGRAACLIRLGRHAEAEALLRTSLAIYEASEPGGWRAALVRSRLGAALSGQRKYAEAEPLLIDGYTGLRDRRPTVPLLTFTPDDRAGAAEAADRLVALYEAMGRPEGVKKWRDERAKLPPCAPRFGPLKGRVGPAPGLVDRPSRSRVRCTVESQVPSRVMTAAGRAHELLPGAGSEPGSDDDPGASLRAPPDCVRDSTPRSAAHISHHPALQ